MNPTNSCLRAVVVGLGVLVWPAAAEAAKGVIKSGNAGGMAGAVVVISGTTAGNITQPGDTIPFREITPPDVREGSTVTFDIVPDVPPPGVPPDPTSTGEMAANIHFLAAGTVITQPVSANIAIGTNESYLVKSSGVISGNVTINGGALILTGGGRVDGNVHGTNGAGVVIDPGSSFRGNLRIGAAGGGTVVRIADSAIERINLKTTQTAHVRITGSTIAGKIDSKSDTMVIIRNCTIDGKLDIKNATQCSTSGNMVSGSTKLDPNCR